MEYYVLNYFSLVLTDESIILMFKICYFIFFLARKGEECGGGIVFFLIEKYSKSFSGILIWNAVSLKGSLALVSAAESLIKANIESDKIYMHV